MKCGYVHLMWCSRLSVFTAVCVHGCLCSRLSVFTAVCVHGCLCSRLSVFTAVCVHGCLCSRLSVVYVLMLFTGSMRSLSAQQFYDEPDEYVAFMRHLNAAFTLVFTIECVLKLIAYGLRVRAWYVLMLIDTLSDSTPSFLLRCHQLFLRW